MATAKASRNPVPSVKVLAGDITKVPADALITAVNSEGMWFGGIDGALQRVAGNHFHSQAAARMPLHDLDVVYALGKVGSSLPFKSVIFVVDDLQSKLSKVLYSGLVVAQENNCATVSIPAIRTGVMLGAVEKSLQEVGLEYKAAIDSFRKDYPQSRVSCVNFVIYGNPELEKLIPQ